MLLTSTTYQSLHSAMNKLKKGTKETLESDDESLEEEQDENFEDFDLIATVKKRFIFDEIADNRLIWPLLQFSSRPKRCIFGEAFQQFHIYPSRLLQARYNKWAYQRYKRYRSFLNSLNKLVNRNPSCNKYEPT